MGRAFYWLVTVIETVYAGILGDDEQTYSEV